MLKSKISLSLLAIGAVLAVAAPATLTQAQTPALPSSTAAGPADTVSGYYRGTIAGGPNDGQAVVVTVVKQRPDKIQFKTNKPSIRDADSMIKMDGTKLVPAEGSTLVFSFDTAANPMKLEYKDGAGGTFTGAKI